MYALAFLTLIVGPLPQSTLPPLPQTSLPVRDEYYLIVAYQGTRPPLPPVPADYVIWFDLADPEDYRIAVDKNVIAIASRGLGLPCYYVTDQTGRVVRDVAPAVTARPPYRPFSKERFR